MSQYYPAGVRYHGASHGPAPSSSRAPRGISREESRRVTMKPVLSVIVPFYNEDESIRGMHTAIVEAVEPLGVATMSPSPG